LGLVIIIEVIGTLLSGLGLFFTGLKFITVHLKKMTGWHIRQLLAKWSKNSWITGPAGSFANRLAGESCKSRCHGELRSHQSKVINAVDYARDNNVPAWQIERSDTSNFDSPAIRRVHEVD